MHELTPRPRTCPAPHPLEDGVLVRRHARPNLRWRDRGVIVGVVVVLVQVLDGFFRELPVQVRRPFPWGRSWLRGRGRGQQGSRRGRLDRDAPPFLASGLQGQWPPAAWSLSCWQTDLRGALGGLFTASPSHCGKLSPKPPDTPWLTRAAPGSAGLQARVTGPGSTPTGSGVQAPWNPACPLCGVKNSAAHGGRLSAFTGRAACWTPP